MDLDNNLLNEPIVFCPAVSEDALLIDEIKDIVSNDIIKFGKSFIDDNIISNDKSVKKLINKNIGLKPLTYIEIVRI